MLSQMGDAENHEWYCDGQIHVLDPAPVEHDPDDSMPQ
jgi:hypothetical protein